MKRKIPGDTHQTIAPSREEARTGNISLQGDGSEMEKEKFEAAHDSITRYLKESAILRMAHVLSNPTSMQMFAEQKAAPEVLQRIAVSTQPPPPSPDPAPRHMLSLANDV